MILLLGGSGFIGARLLAALRARGQPVAYTFASHKLPLDIPGYALDLTRVRSDDLAQLIAQLQPDVVVHSAVMPINGDFIHHHSVSAYSVVRLTQALAEHCPQAQVIYLSTDCVFGSGRGQYTEQDLPDARLRHPKDVYRSYGVTRATGEALLREHWPNSLIVRTSVVDGRDALGELSARLAALIAQLESGVQTKRLNDRYFTPTLIDTLIDALCELIEPAFTYRGILHIAGSERTTNYAYARALARRIRADETQVVPESLAESSVAMLPTDSSLDVSLAQRLLHTPMLNVEAQLGRIFDTIATSPGR